MVESATGSNRNSLFFVRVIVSTPLVEVDIGLIEPQCLSEPEPPVTRNQSEESRKGPPAFSPRGEGSCAACSTMRASSSSV